jgi:hypothetical protein
MVRLAVVACLVACSSAPARTPPPVAVAEAPVTAPPDHPQTLPLEGAHARVACEKCHVEGQPLPGIGCANCHATPHAGDTFDKRVCVRCHADTAERFSDITLDHTELTGSALGRHEKVSCVSCHPKATASTLACTSCHTGVQAAPRKISLHGTRFAGRECTECHAMSGWNPGRFQHASTGFSLWPWHDKYACRSCHPGSDPATFLRLPRKPQCGVHCHQDVHERKFKPADCLKCHVYPGAHEIRGPLNQPRPRSRT